MSELQPQQRFRAATCTTRVIRSAEWRLARDLRLRALRDEQAGLAFFTTYDEAVARSEQEWRSSALDASLEAAPPVTARQFVAIAPAGEWVGTVTVRLQTQGSPDFGGGVADRDRGMLLAVWIDPDHRGQGLLDEMVELAAGWLRTQGVDSLGLWVHEDNTRARRAYRSAGFAPTGRRVVDRIGPEVELVRAI